MLIALVVFVFTAGLVVATETTLRPHLRHDPVNLWLAAHIYFPALRMLALLAFVLSAYPDLFGADDLPPLDELLGAQSAWFGVSLNLLFAAALFAPLLPVLGGIPGVVLPVQGVAMTALLASWLAERLDQPLTLWPGLGVAAGMLLLAAAGPLIAAMLVRLGHTARHRLTELALLGAQLPVIFLYGQALGRQIPGT